MLETFKKIFEMYFVVTGTYWTSSLDGSAVGWDMWLVDFELHLENGDAMYWDGEEVMEALVWG